MAIQAFFNSDGTEVTAVITVVGSDGNHVDPDSWPITNDPAIVLSSHPAAAKTITKIDTGVYTAEWSSLSPVLNNGDVVNIAIDGAISATAWSTWRTFLQVMRTPSSFDPATDTVDVGKVSGNATAADNLEFQYDGTTGLTGDTFPSTQLQVGGIATGAGGISAVADSFTLTTGTQSAGTVTSTEAKDGTVHTIVPATSIIDCYYEFDIGVNGKATEIIWDGYVGNNSDNVEVFGYDWVSSSFKQVGVIAGKNANTVEEQIFIFTNAMTGTGANAGKVRCQFKSDGADVAVDLNTDRILCEYTSVAADALILHSGVAQAGSSNTITLDSGANANDDFYNHALVVITSGTGSEQERIIVDYNGTTKVATIAPPWVTTPDTTSAFDVLPGTSHAETGWATIKVGLAAAATSTTITLSSDASSIDDYYNGDVVYIDEGTGEGQRRMISDYNGTTKVATVSSAWTTTPDTTSEYVVEVGHPWSPEWDTSAADAVWDDTATRNVASSPGKRLRQLEEGVISAESSVNDVSASTTSFVTNLTSAVDDYYNDKILVFTDGALAGQSRVITDYNGTTKAVTFDEATTSAPADATQFIILAMHQHSIAQIQSGLATSAALATVDSNVDAILVDTGTTLPATLTTIEGKVDTVDTVVDAVKVKTDQLTFTVANQVDSNALTGGGGDDAATIYTYFTSLSREDSFKADVSALATQASVDTVDANVDAILVDTSTTIPALLPSGFNTLVINAGAVDSLVQGFLNTAITETTAGNIADNFDTFYNNANALTTKVVDNVGGGGSVSIGPEDIDAIVAGVTAVSDNIQDAQAGLLTAYTASTWSQQITDTTMLTGYDSIVFTLKKRPSDPDSKALLKVSSDVGLEVLNGVSTGLTAADASITIDQQTPTGEVTLTVAASAMANIPQGKWHDGWKKLDAASTDATLRAGRTVIRDGVVDETS